MEQPDHRHGRALAPVRLAGELAALGVSALLFGALDVGVSPSYGSGRWVTP